jgi:Di-haem oxidoreductase, putative peroxidase
MRRSLVLVAFALPLMLLIVLARAQSRHPAFAANGGPDDPVSIHADVVATGIPGAGAIAQIGKFHTGGPFHDNSALAPSTQPGQVLDGKRLFVASSSNFGAPLARPLEAAGAILSIDVSGGAESPVAVPADFARSGGQASAAAGKVILYTAQSPPFTNGVKNPTAVTNALPAVSLPLGISFNNGFGRPWFANAPNGSSADGTISVVDPGGFPLNGAPDPVAGGVFTGTITNRNGALIGGLTSAAVATALATKSPDLSVRAVFFAALADGSVQQVHVQKGVDQLVPPGSFTPIAGISTDAAESAHPDVVTRVGMIFNWVPTRILYITDPLADRILAIDISDESSDPTTSANALFSANNARYLTSPFFDRPVDIAPATTEVAARNFASNTTLGGGSDFYVLNRGNNSIIRMTQNGRVVARQQIHADIPAFRVNGLAVSDDARTIWITATAPQRQGVVLRIPAFGAGGVTASLIDAARIVDANGAPAQGEHMFTQQLGLDERLGPLFNGQSCDTCHNNVAGDDIPGGMGAGDDTFAFRVAHLEPGSFDPLLGRGGPVARQHSIVELGVPCDLPTGIPSAANVISKRSAMTLRGTSLLDNIRTVDIERTRLSQPDTVRGRMNILSDGRVGRFGWKAHSATLVEFMAEALRDELGVTSPLAPTDLVRGCGTSSRPEADAVPLTSLVAFLDTIDPPAPTSICLTSPGAAVFQSVGCSSCHQPNMFGPGNSGPNPTTIHPFTDLLLHEMGPGLADGILQGSATGSEFRTMPLWRVSDRVHFLHDGRAHTIEEAIRAHGGQAAAARDAFNTLGAADRVALMNYLGCI